MSSYDYLQGIERIKEIFECPNETEVVDKIPKESAFTFDNGFYGWVTSIFVDLRNSYDLFNNSSIKRTTVAKIMRCFTSEVIEILRNDENLREIGIRGDCVYAIYSTSQKNEDYEIFDKAIFVNTFMKMFNTFLAEKNLPPLEYGIGISTWQDLVVKAGREMFKINNLVWIGKGVSLAAHLSSLGNKNDYGPIVLSGLFYDGLKSYCETNPSIVSFKSDWFSKTKNLDIDDYEIYHCNLIKTGFNDWIINGMKNE